jgi:hypothetical protein
MKKVTLGVLIIISSCTMGFAQLKLGNKILEKITPPTKEEPSKQPEIKKKSDGSTEIITSDGTLTIEESTSADAVPNTFLGSFRMNMQSTDSKGKTITSSAHYYFSKWKTAMESNLDNNSGQMRMIFDLQNRKTTMLTTDKKGHKSGIIMKMPKFSYKSDKLDNKVEQMIDGTTYRKTGEKKEIEGYLCEKWIMTNEYGETEAWITDQIDFNLANVFGFFSISAGMPGSKSPKYKQFESMRGFSLETIHTSTKGEKTIVTVTNIKIGDVGNAPFSTEGYEVQDMSSLGDMFGR